MSWISTGIAVVGAGAQIANSLSGSKKAEKAQEALINAAGTDTSSVFNVLAPGGVGAIQGNIVGNTGANESLTFEQLAAGVTSIEQNPDGSLVSPTPVSSEILDAAGSLARAPGVPEGPLVDTGLKSDGQNILLIDPNSGQIFLKGKNSIGPFTEDQAFGPNGPVQLEATDGGFRLDPAQFMPGGELGTVTLADGTQINSVAPGGNNIALTAGDLEPTRAGAVQLAGITTGKAGVAITEGLSPELQEAFKNVADTLGVELDLDPGEILSQITQSIPGLLGQAEADLTQAQQKQFGGDVENLGTKVAETALGELTTGFEGIRESTLENLRKLALPAEERAADRLATRLFGTGRLGTTGGSQLFADLAESQNRADLERQLASTAEARKVGEFTQGLATTGIDVARVAATTADDLVTQATNRFTSLTDTGVTVGAEAITRQEGGAAFETGQAKAALGLGIAEEALPGQQAGQFLNLSQDALGIQEGIQQQTVQAFDVGQQAGGAATEAAQFGVRAQLAAGTPTDFRGDVIGAGIESVTSLASDIFSNLGGQGGTTTTSSLTKAPKTAIAPLSTKITKA